MTLEEAIKHCEEKAKEQDKLATRYEDASGYSRSHIESLKTDESIKCRACASEHRQLAELLRELKALKENDNVKEAFKDCDTCKYLNIEPDDYPCDRCMHRYINQYVYDDKREVNADE